MHKSSLIFENLNVRTDSSSSYISGQHFFSHLRNPVSVLQTMLLGSQKHFSSKEDFRKPFFKSYIKAYISVDKLIVL